MEEVEAAAGARDTSLERSYVGLNDTTGAEEAPCGGDAHGPPVTPRGRATPREPATPTLASDIPTTQHGGDEPAANSGNNEHLVDTQD